MYLVGKAEASLKERAIYYGRSLLILYLLRRRALISVW
jgi:hypothetical protein